MHWSLSVRYIQEVAIFHYPRLPYLSFHFCRSPPFPTHLRTPKEENRTRIDVIIIDISSQLRRIPIHHTRTSDRIQIINIQIRRFSGVVDEDGGLALGIGGLGGTACGERKN